MSRILSAVSYFDPLMPKHRCLYVTGPYFLSLWDKTRQNQSLRSGTAAIHDAAEVTEMADQPVSCVLNADSTVKLYT